MNMFTGFMKEVELFLNSYNIPVFLVPIIPIVILLITVSFLIVKLTTGSLTAERDESMKVAEDFIAANTEILKNAGTIFNIKKDIYGTFRGFHCFTFIVTGSLRELKVKIEVYKPLVITGQTQEYKISKAIIVSNDKSVSDIKITV